MLPYCGLEVDIQPLNCNNHMCFCSPSNVNQEKGGRDDQNLSGRFLLVFVRLLLASLLFFPPLFISGRGLQKTKVACKPIPSVEQFPCTVFPVPRILPVSVLADWLADF